MSAAVAGAKCGVTRETVNLWSSRGIIVAGGRREVLGTVAVEGLPNRLVRPAELERFLRVTADFRGPGMKPRRRKGGAGQKALA
jgi:hypothetical protein